MIKKILILFYKLTNNLKSYKMNNIKDIVIGIFAVIGFAAIVTGFTNEAGDPQYPESHVWEMEVSEADNGRAYLYNKTTGEVRKYDVGSSFLGSEYVVTKENVPKKKKK